MRGGERHGLCRRKGCLRSREGMPILKLLYRVVGLLSLGLGIAGMVLPILPTTPFLLLSLWCFSRSSERLEGWLLTNPLFGRYLDDYRNGRGIPRRVKGYILLLLWGTILYTAFALVDPWWLQGVLLAVAVGVTLHIVRQKTKRNVPEAESAGEENR